MNRTREIGGDIVVFIDDQRVLKRPGRLDDTVSVYAGTGGGMFVRVVLIDGDLDPYTIVFGPNANCR